MDQPRGLIDLGFVQLVERRAGECDAAQVFGLESGLGRPTDPDPDRPVADAALLGRQLREVGRAWPQLRRAYRAALTDLGWMTQTDARTECARVIRQTRAELAE